MTKGDCSKACIYEIRYGNASYIGSTVTRHIRFSNHRRQSIEGTQPIHELIRTHGWDNLTVTILEEYPCDSFSELRQREQHWMDAKSPSLNKQRAWISRDDRMEQQRTLAKARYFRVRDKILARMAERYAARAHSEGRTVRPQKKWRREILGPEPNTDVLA